MNSLQVVAVAFRALISNKMRSFLTALGVVIGVAAVIAMTAIGAGARARVDKTFESMGSNMLVVRSGSHRQGGPHGAAGSQMSLTWDDLAALREQVANVRYVAPMLAKQVQVMAEGQNWATTVQGTTPDFFGIRNWPMAQGRGFEPLDLDSGAKVAIVGKTVVSNLFGADADPLGQVIRLGNVPFVIVGVAAEKGQAGPGGDQDDVVFVPVTTYRAKLQGGLSQFIAGSVFVSATSQAVTSQVQADIETILRTRHRIREGAQDDFTVRNLSDMATAQAEGAATLTALLAAIALVSLVVGGIGVMNIMLVSVTERTREIGLRMSVGARPFDILSQFLVEAVALAMIGGVLGVALGLGTAAYLASRFEWPMLVQFPVIALSFGFSALVGMVFGLWPAVKASRLDPIQALRFE